MKNYKTPEFEIIKFATGDIMALSFNQDKAILGEIGSDDQEDAKTWY